MDTIRRSSTVIIFHRLGEGTSEPPVARMSLLLEG